MLFAHAASLLILAFALSLDSFGVGLTYGMRRLRIPWLSVLIISICSGLVIFASMHVGALFIHWFSDRAASILGALILIGIGIWAMVQFFQSQDTAGSVDITLEHESKHDSQALEQSSPEPQVQQILKIQLKRIGIIIQILRTPDAADMDRSGTISAQEAAWLGVALSLDAFGAGIGAALLGYSPIWTALIIAIFSGTFLQLGIRIGITFGQWRWLKRLSFLPGCLLIIIGIMKLF
ncbi:sporulation membrane protein YtaF [Paenibacillus aquistagni]|uniref:sporulation membrane protein YtaF n=1 Tax=Paenibacillus aquistagni TaxID=1852522 RepID=UPI000B50E264|nr:sporulation membrane protein YtaF [Paenibacillus aquistagni]